MMAFVQKYYYTDDYSAINMLDSAANSAVEMLGDNNLSRGGTAGNIMLETSGTRLELQVDDTRDVKRISGYLNDLIRYLQKSFPAEDSEKIFETVVNGAFSGLDPHTSYLSPNDYKEMIAATAGEFSGVGIEISIKDRQLTVVSPIEDSPAELAGLLAGDIITAIDGKSTEGMSLMDAVRMIRGPEGSKVVLTVLHRNNPAAQAISVYRRKIEFRSVKAKEIEPGYLHLRLTRFDENSIKKVRAALGKNPYLKGVVLDLRNNPGGTLSSSVAVADSFMPSGKVVSIQGRDVSKRKDFLSNTDSSDYSGPLVVLINAGSASASEIVSGSLQDRSRALILGTTSFGKGTVQTIIPLKDGGAFKLTSAQYFLPNMHRIQGVGIIPDFYVYDPAKQSGEVLRESQLPHALAPGEADVDRRRKKIQVRVDKDHDGVLLTALQIIKQSGSRDVRKLRAAADRLGGGDAAVLTQLKKESYSPADVQTGTDPVISDNKPPQITLINPASPRGLSVKHELDRIMIRAEVHDPSGISWVLVNGQRVPVDADRFSKEIVLNPGRNMVIINAADKVGNITNLTFNIDKQTRKAEDFYGAAAPSVRPSLWALCIGVSSYRDARMNLKFAADDARALARTLEKSGKGLYRDIRVRVLTDSEATRENIIENMSSFLGQAGKDDIVMIFVAGHGVRYKPTGSYYFMTHDSSHATMVARALKWSDFQEMIKIIKGNTNKIVLALDTCHAGAMELGLRAGGSGEDLAATMQKASGIYTIGASKSGEESIESEQFSIDNSPGHGVFTYSLIQGLSGRANLDNNSYISIMELLSYISREVPRLSNGRQHPYAKVTGTDLPLSRVGK